MTQKEAYAVLVFTRQFRHYLVGQRFVLQTNNQVLMSMFRNVTALPVILRRALQIPLLDFDLLLETNSCETDFNFQNKGLFH